MVSHVAPPKLSGISHGNKTRNIARRRLSGITQDIEDCLVLLGRIELPTSSLPMTRSTTELQQHTQKVAPMRRDGAVVKRLAPLWAIWHRVREQAEWIGEGTWQKTRKTKSGLRPNDCVRPCVQISVAAKQSRKAQNRTHPRISHRPAGHRRWLP